MRRPPQVAAVPQSGLRINYGEPPSVVKAPPPPPPNFSMDEPLARHAATALRIADSALADIETRLAVLEEALRTSMNVRRLSPQVLITLQIEIDSAVEAVEQLATAAHCDGRDLLLGGWSLALPGTPAGSQVISLLSAHPRSLGDGRVGTLASTAGQGRNSLRSGHLTTVRTIVRGACRQIMKERERLAAWLEGVVRPLLASQEVAAENEAACQAALLDDDFTRLSSQFTAADALVAGQLTHRSQGPPSGIHALLFPFSESAQHES